MLNVLKEKTNMKNETKKLGIITRGTTNILKAGAWIASPVYTPVTSQISESGGRISTLFDRVNPIGLKNRLKKNARAETYEDAVKRLHLQEQDIQKSYNLFTFMAKLAALLFISFVMLGIYKLLGSEFLSGSQFLVFSLVHFALAHRYAFRAFQIRRKKLGGHEEFIESKNEWFPKTWSVK